MKLHRLLLAIGLLLSTAIGAWADDVLSMEDFSISPGETKTVQVMLDNTTTFSGFQCNIYMPDGLDIGKDEDGDYDFALLRGTSSHMVTSNLRETGIIAVGSISTKSKDFTGNSGAFLEFPITASENFSGTAEIWIKDIYFFDNMGEQYDLADCSSKVTAVIPVTGITLDQSSLEITIGESTTLTATVLPENANDKTVTWKSSNTSIVTVDENGKVTAITVGTTTIAATAENYSAICEVTVKPIEAQSVTLNLTSATLKVGETTTLTATVLPEDTTDKTITWSSSNPTVVSVSSEGLVTALGVGQATITATCGAVSATCDVTVNPVEVTSISLSASSLTLTEGDSATLIATILPENATDKTVTWLPSNTAIATVDANGKVTAIAAGTATITATCGSVSATCEVTVNALVIPAAGITLSQTSLTLTEGDSATLIATILPENATDKTVTWLSSNTAIATVDANGKVTAIAAGTATITATCGSVSATCEVTVNALVIPATGITLSQTSLTLTEGETATLTATVAPENATDKTVTWTSSNTAIATVDANGKVTAIAAGTATITATCGSVSATCEVTVNALVIPATGITLSQTSLTLTEGETTTLTATVAPDNATDKTVTWLSSNTAIATVDANGKVTAIAAGTATITATCGSVSATCEVTVNAAVISVTGISLNSTRLNLYVDDTFQLIATVTPDNATDKSVTWASSDVAVVTVDQNGLVIAVGVGSASVSATSGDCSISCLITVSEKTPEVIPATGITLSQISLTLTEGENATLTATVAPDNATDKTVTWTSSNDAVASVDENGKVTAVAAGTATITATCGSVSATCEVTVNAAVIPVTGITLNTQRETLYVDDTLQLIATVSPENATDKTVTWASSDVAVVTVDQNGLVTAVGVGTASVSATSVDCSISCLITVNEKEPEVVPATGITLDQTTLTLEEGSSATLTATVTPENATDKTVTWSSSNTAVAMVANGVVTAIAEGNATITASCGAVSATCAVTVTAKAPDPNAPWLKLEPSTLSIGEGQTGRVTASWGNFDLATTPIHISSSDTDVAVTANQTANHDLIIYGLCVGNADLRIYTDDGLEAVCALSVLARPTDDKFPKTIDNFVLDRNAFGQITITGYNGTTPVDFEIPSQIGGHDIYGVDPQVFATYGVTKRLTVCEGITYSGYASWYGATAINSVYFPESVTLSDGLEFYQCANINKVIWPGQDRFIDVWGLGVNTSSDRIFYLSDPDYREYAFSDNIRLYERLGEWFDDGLVRYVPYDDDSVDVIDIAPNVGDDLTIPSQVFDGSKEWTVRSINRNAFVGNSSIRELYLDREISQIESCAFRNITPESIKVGSTDPSSYNAATDAFSGVNYSTPLYVPNGTASAYKALAPWSNFYNIKEYNASGEVEILEADDSDDVRYYNMQGQRVKNPAPGFYVRVQGDTATKILVK